MFVAAELDGQLLIDQPVVEAFVARLVFAVSILVGLHELTELLAVELRDVLENHADVLRIERAFVLGVVGRVLEDYSLAEVVDRRGAEDFPALLQSLLVIGLVGDRHIHTEDLPALYLLSFLS